MFDLCLITPAQLTEVAAFYVSLDAQTRYSRFFAHLSDYAIFDRVLQLNLDKSFLVGARKSGALVGVVEAGLYGDTAELGVAVSEVCRGMGVGQLLCHYAISVAHERSARHIEVITSYSNTPMQRLALRAGMQASRVDGDWHGDMQLSEDRPASHRGCLSRGPAVAAPHRESLPQV